MRLLTAAGTGIYIDLPFRISIIDNNYFKKVIFMSLEQLYQEKILAFARIARASTSLDGAHYTATIKNPTCGDRVRIDLDLDENSVIVRLGAAADGCALCEAATGFLLTVAPGQNASEIEGYSTLIETWLKDENASPHIDGQEAFTPVKAFASRHGCVALPFQALTKALSNGGENQG